MTPDPHALRPIRYRVWGRRNFRYRVRCAVEGCRLPPSDHSPDE